MQAAFAKPATSRLVVRTRRQLQELKQTGQGRRTEARDTLWAARPFRQLPDEKRAK